jgi:hypothetical protein
MESSRSAGGAFICNAGVRIIAKQADSQQQAFRTELALLFDIIRTASYKIVVKFDFGRTVREIGDIRYGGIDEKVFPEINWEDGINGIDSLYCLW